MNTDANDKPLPLNSRLVSLRNILFFLAVVAATVIIYPVIKGLLDRSQDQYYDYILIIPFISGFLFFLGRKSIFSEPHYELRVGMPFMLTGVVLYLFTISFLNVADKETMMVFSALLAFAGAYICVYGTKSFRTARFPLLFLAFTIPVPVVILEKFVYILQISSTEAADFLFNLTGAPYYREGVLFHLPNVSIEVAKECSGIRSSLAMIVTGVLAAHFFLDRGWRQIVLVLSVFPITVLKNGIRIVTLTLLAVYVDVRFLTQSFLHHSGGFLFYIPGLVLLGLEVWIMRKDSK